MSTYRLPEFRITIEGLWIDGSVFAAPVAPAELDGAIGETPRVMIANPKVPEWREVRVFDEIGIYLLCNRNPHVVSSVNFVWRPTEVPYPPGKAYGGEVLFCNTILKDGLTPETLPQTGPIVPKGVVAGRFAAEFGAFCLSLHFTKNRDALGKRCAATLADAEFSFSEVNLPKDVISERMQRN